MFKILVTVLLLSSSLCMNPGAYGFVSKKTIEAFKDSAWPKVKELLSNIEIDENKSYDVTIGTLNIRNLKVSINLEADGVSIDLNSQDNLVQTSAYAINFSGEGHWQLKTFQWSTEGDLKFNGTIGSLQADIKNETRQVKDGLVPIIRFNTITLKNINHLNIEEKSNTLAPVINLLTDRFRSNIEKQIQQQLSNNGGLKTKLGDSINKKILQNYRNSIPIKKYGVKISTYITHPLKVFDTGIQIPVEGFTYAIDSGYKKNENCKEMKDYVDPANVTSDFYAALGDCTVKSVIDAQAEHGSKFDLKEKTPVADIDVIVQLQKWDGTSVEFYHDNLKVGVAIVATGMVGGYSVTARANAVANVSQIKKSTNNEVHAQSPAYKKMFSGITPEIIASYDIVAKIEKLDNFKVDGLPDFFANLLKTTLMQNNFTTNYDVHQVCQADVCLKTFNAVVKEGFIAADANVYFRPLREEIS